MNAIADQDSQHYAPVYTRSYYMTHTGAGLREMDWAQLSADQQNAYPKQPTFPRSEAEKDRIMMRRVHARDLIKHDRHMVTVAWFIGIMVAMPVCIAGFSWLWKLAIWAVAS
jgi:hypothetical protein